MTTTHTPTPISTRMATIAKSQGWTDNSYYGDTDYGLAQEFERGPHMVRLDWGPDGRHGASDELLSISVTDNRFKPVVKTVFHVEGRDQVYMRGALTEALTYYAVNLIEPQETK
jgi:hypothetical protein